MDLGDLNDDEATVLLGMMREIVRADGEYSDGERAAVEDIRKGLGRDRFDRTLLRARDRYMSLGELKEDAKALSRQDAKQRIFAALQAIATSDGMGADEEKPLRWLASWWHLQV